MQGDYQLTAEISAAALEGTLEEYRRTVLEGLKRTIGFDIGLGWSVGEGPARPAFCGFDGALWSRFTANAPVYQRELAPIVRRAMARGVAIDTHIYGPERRRLAIVRDIIEPLGMFSGLAVGVAWRGRHLALFRIGRQSRRGFRAAEIARTLRLMPLLRLAESLQRVACPIPIGDASLTPQESALLELFATGHSYANAAAQLGVTLNTIRSHVRNLYAKLGASSKIDAMRKARRGPASINR